LQLWQELPPQLVLQQTPCAQFPVAQLAAEVQATPIAIKGAHTPFVAQYFPEPQSALVVQEPEVPAVHCPDAHCWPDWHAVPHVPQLFTSVARLAQVLPHNT
jgi:hypothetical protein